ncbi:MAG: hypothetical protein ABIQ04_00985 [Candidatus Saccharimonadales bacterium]
MGLMEDAKAKLDEAKDTAKDTADKISQKTDIAKQRVEGEIDKAKGDNLKGEAKIKTSEVRDKLS